MRHRFAVGLGLLSVALAGCGERASDTAPPTSLGVRIELGTRFDPASSGDVQGRITWEGTIPSLADSHAAIPLGPEGFRWTMMPVPYKPAVDAKTRGLAGSVVYLRGVDAAHSRSWNHPPVSVVQQDYQIRVKPGGPNHNVGIVRLGDEVMFSSADPTQHMLRARGAAYFTLPFPEPNQPLARCFDKPGIVELTSGAGMAWMAADIFVVGHPYYTITESDGTFVLSQVPAGEYELVAWVRNWHVEDSDRDTETGITIRNRYARPVEKTARLRVEPLHTATHDLQFSPSDFKPTDQLP